MHFEILVEDASGRIILESVLDKILSPSEDHTFKVVAYKGVGRIPPTLKGTVDPQKRILLDRLPKLLRGYGKSFRDYEAAVIVVVDLDRRDCIAFKQELLDILETCDPLPTVLFRIAIEEGEAWLLGGLDAVRSAYPRVREQVLRDYEQDSICGTWEKLADAIYAGGAKKLKKLGYPEIGQVKCEWARRIAPLLEVDNHQSNSFRVLRDGIRSLAGIDAR